MFTSHFLGGSLVGLMFLALGTNAQAGYCDENGVWISTTKEPALDTAWKRECARVRRYQANRKEEGVQVDERTMHGRGFDNEYDDASRFGKRTRRAWENCLKMKVNKMVRGAAALGPMQMVAFYKAKLSKAVTGLNSKKGHAKAHCEVAYAALQELIKCGEKQKYSAAIQKHKNDIRELWKQLNWYGKGTRVGKFYSRKAFKHYMTFGSGTSTDECEELRDDMADFPMILKGRRRRRLIERLAEAELAFRC